MELFQPGVELNPAEWVENINDYMNNFSLG